MSPSFEEILSSRRHCAALKGKGNWGMEVASHKDTTSRYLVKSLHYATFFCDGTKTEK
jgi:hypothetical protein